MFALALLPLACYFVFLTCLYFRRIPTVLDGSLDFALLAWGLSGLITLGPGRLMIPLYVYAAWGIYTWFFWFGFYYIVVYILSSLFKDRLVVYNGRRELVLPAFYSLIREIDPKTEWGGNVLSFHGLGLQWAVTGGKHTGHLTFVPTSPQRKNPHLEKLQKQLKNLCRTLVMPKSRIRWIWGFFTLALCCFVIGVFLKDCPILLQQFNDYWLPYR